MNMFKTTLATIPDEYISLFEEPRKTEIKQLHNLIHETVPIDLCLCDR